MARYPDLNKNQGVNPSEAMRNVITFPGAESLSGDAASDPDEIHRQQAKDLKPSAMSRDAVKLWNQYAPYMIKLGRLKPHYVETFREYCECAGQMRRLQRQLNEDRSLTSSVYYETVTRNGIQRKIDPRVSQMNELRRILRGFVAQFGLAPASEKTLVGDGQLSLLDDLDEL